MVSENTIYRFYLEHKTLVWFMFLAALARVVFWAYTGRIWEDALITLTPALNVWDGMGLTHHPSEPRVHSFTSPLSVLIPIIGEGLVGDGLVMLRLTALIAGVASVWYAYWICKRLNIHQSGVILVLGYLSLDQLQIFFGMAGMETQVATAILLGGFYYLLEEKWVPLGVCCGLATIARPEFFAFVGIVGIWLLVFNRAAIIRVVATACCFTVPWYLFAFLYFGSIIPNTVYAKTWGGKIGLFSSTKEQMLEYFYGSWSHIAPFREWWFVQEAPLPDLILKSIVFLVLFTFLFGAITAIKEKNYKLIILIVTVLVFITYRSASVINPYFMWYLPPFMALLFIISAYGMNTISKYNHRLALFLSTLIVIAYGMHIPYSFPIEKQVQEKIEHAVRSEVGKSLNKLMKDDDSVFLEPLGYIGIEIRGKTTYDFPGLSSPIVIDTIRNLPQVRMGGVIEVLQPEYLVLRPREINEFEEYYKETAAKYSVIETIQAKQGLIWSIGGYRVIAPDGHFSILRRNDIN